MKISRRELLQTAPVATAGVAMSALVGNSSTGHAGNFQESSSSLPAAFEKLQPLGDRVKPIRVEEFQGRIAHAQELMANSKDHFDAMFVTPGTTLSYYLGFRWGLSERILALLIPQKGNPVILCPAFEQGRLHEQLRWPIEVRAWQEDEKPYAMAGKWFAERGIRAGRIGIEQTTRFVFFDGLRRAAPVPDYASADPITIGCRAQKSDAELELMRLACSATFDVYKATFASLHDGMTQRDVAGLISQGYAKMGLGGYALVLFGPSAALPHGTQEEQILREGVGVLIDGGTSVEGYESDVTRTSVMGKPSAKLLRAFEIVHRSQDAALAAAQSGRECGSVDDAARKVIIDAKFGPGYKYFTHRLGHGIGLDGHESPYLVRGNHTLMKPRMTFSNEPGIYVVGDYGLRCEDDMVIVDSGAAHLLTPGFQPSLENPIA
jgi:Xaa-Pro dipeptidase